eukprot:gnl/TRDRNA2_/TRDRNA2_172133_c0_seq1.p1 gnl/TRDRNA2_/TRDRNA2_172133_c0~~gnl/TRDRNA2_/TRDRNA2_172133_c0_seq1.p1  ORF type:complete len:463 (+),score=63.43 gnl/TRDRNA2_/TRDRNA2_172133_c0_seq1:116-1390(+)
MLAFIAQAQHAERADKLIDRGLQARRLQHADLHDTTLAKVSAPSSCCSCRSCDGLRGVPARSVCEGPHGVPARRLSEGGVLARSACDGPHGVLARRLSEGASEDHAASVGLASKPGRRRLTGGTPEVLTRLRCFTNLLNRGVSGTEGYVEAKGADGSALVKIVDLPDRSDVDGICMTRKSSSSSSCTKRICTPAGRIVPKETPESVSSMSTEPLKRVGRKDRPTVLAEAGINVRPAISTDAGQITELANTAFMEDGVYKDPEKIDQFTVEQTLGTIKEGEFADETGATAGGVDVRFLVAEEAATAHMPASDVKRLAGCVLVVMPLVLPQVLESLKHPPPRSQAMEASFGMLAVSPAFWNSVAGDLLVKAAEEFILQNGETTFALSYGLKPNGQILRIAIAVVNIRSDAVAFYSRRGSRPGSGGP